MKLPFSFFRRLLAGCLLAAALAGCTTNPMTGRSQFMMVSEQSAIAQSTSAYQSMIGELEKEGKISTDAAVNTRIRGITDRLVSQAVRYRPEVAEWGWSIKVIENPEVVNAFCMPGGRMAIYTGLIDKLKATDDELAQVMGHEIAHALANHGAEKMSVQMASSIAVAGATVAANRRNQQATNTVAGLAALAFINLPNSRTAEEEADKLGIELAARAGFHPHAAVTLWEKMSAESGSKSRFDFFSTHPAPPKRIESLARLESPMLQLYDPAERNRPVVVAWTTRSTNERVVGGETHELVSRGAPAAPLTFYSEAFDAFSHGTAELKCDSCAAAFVTHQGGLHDLYTKESWRALAQETLKVGYGVDLAWFYLGAAAERLGFADAAKKYYAEALQRSRHNETACAKGIFVNCAGIDIAHEIRH
jgi:Zn-dependent protease with chaperone function